MATELVVPYGVDASGTLVSPASADRNARYRCPQCRTELVLRAGTRRIRHFAHKLAAPCNGETLRHLTAKLLLVQTIRNSRGGGGGILITLRRPCACCRRDADFPLPPGSFDSANSEVRIGNYICDVVAHSAPGRVLVIEVCATHEVPPEKAEQLSVPWIEVNAEAIIENPHHWHAVRSRLRPSHCDECKNRHSQVAALAERWHIELPRKAACHDPSATPYLAAIDKCWRCHEEILLFWWRGVPFCEAEPPKPRPPTIQLRFSKTHGGKYWVNTCPKCHAIQGDNFVFVEGRLFAGLPLRPLDVDPVQWRRATREMIAHMLGLPSLRY